MPRSSQYGGGCHCGNLRYVFSANTDPAQWPVRRCTCSYCCRLNAHYTSGPDTSLEVTAREPAAVGRYAFATRTAEFFHCHSCGVMIFASCVLGGNRYAVLNVNTLDDAANLQFKPIDMSFDGEPVADRLARRKQNWIANVRLPFINDHQSHRQEPK